MRFQEYLNQNGQDTFFDISHIRNMSSFLKDCIRKADRVWTDELDCRKSFTREKTDKTPEEVIEIAKKSKYPHYVFILRQTVLRGQGPYIEVGIRTDENEKDYFLWINIKPEKLEYFINKYKLKML